MCCQEMLNKWFSNTKVRGEKNFCENVQSVKSSVVTKLGVVYREDLLQLWSWGFLVWTLRRKYNQVNMITGSLDSWPLSYKDATKRRPQSYWLRQHSLVCLCWTLHFSARNDTPNKKSFLTYMKGQPTFFNSRLQPSTHQTVTSLSSRTKMHFI